MTRTRLAALRPLDIAGYPYGAVWTDPATGYYSVTLAATSPIPLSSTPGARVPAGATTSAR